MPRTTSKFYTIDGISIGKEIGLGGRINTVLQAAFFKLSGIIPADKAVTLMKEAAKKSYGKKGDKVVQMNYDAIDRGIDGAVKVEVPASWKDAKDEKAAEAKTAGTAAVASYIDSILKPVNAQRGNKLPVSAFVDYADGTVPLGTAAYEKRGIAVDVPEWNPDNCIQCNFCSYVCPHAAIRPVAMTEEEAAAAPAAHQDSADDRRCRPQVHDDRLRFSIVPAAAPAPTSAPARRGRRPWS